MRSLLPCVKRLEASSRTGVCGSPGSAAWDGLTLFQLAHDQTILSSSIALTCRFLDHGEQMAHWTGAFESLPVGLKRGGAC